MNVADYIFKFLSDKGTDEVFMVSGGQAMYLIDALYKNGKFNVICTHHEQTAGMSADAYGRISGKPSVALVTAGPGAVNVINGVVGGWTDSSPMIVISGQSNLANVKYQEKTGIRQHGVQGINIKPLVESVTKYFVTIDDPAKILTYLETAYYLCTKGRPGPVWLDVPLDVQRAEVPENLISEFKISDEVHVNDNVDVQVNQVIKMLNNSKRPVLLVGQGVRLAGAILEFNNLISKLKIPILTARLGLDLIESDNDLYVGRPGTYGERSAHFAIQNSDLLITVGCRLTTSLIGHNAKDFARNAKKIVVDIDRAELDKPGLEIDIKILTDAKVFFESLLKKAANFESLKFDSWLNRCHEWKAKYPVVQSSYKNEVPVNSYYFTDRLSKLSSSSEVILVDTGSCFHVASQTWKIKKGQRFLTTGGISSMGYWVAGIGACRANNGQKTIVITGDGSLQMNIQEFATIKHNNLPIKVFIFNNNGYLLIRHTQKNFMEGRMLGEGPESGVWCPDSLEIAKAYGIKGVRIEKIDDLDKKIEEVLNFDGPVICDVMTPEWQLLIPRVASEKDANGNLVQKPYEDMFPYLDRDELAKNMISE